GDSNERRVADDTEDRLAHFIFRRSLSSAFEFVSLQPTRFRPAEGPSRARSSTRGFPTSSPFGFAQDRTTWITPTCDRHLFESLGSRVIDCGPWLKGMASKRASAGGRMGKLVAGALLTVFCMSGSVWAQGQEQSETKQS